MAEFMSSIIRYLAKDNELYQIIGLHGHPEVDERAINPAISFFKLNSVKERHQDSILSLRRDLIPVLHLEVLLHIYWI